MCDLDTNTEREEKIDGCRSMSGGGGDAETQGVVVMGSSWRKWKKMGLKVSG